MITTLTTERLVLRQPIAEDFPEWEAFFRTDRARFVGGGADADMGKRWRAFATIIGHWTMRGFGTFVVTDKATGAPLGSVGPWFPMPWPEPEIGWTIWTPEAEGTGIAAEAARATIDHAFGALGWETAVSYIDAANDRSIALAEKLGAVLDPTASGPHPDDLVYRHPRPEGLQ